MLNKCGLSRNFWAEIMIIANYFRNRFLVVDRNKIPEEF